ncbi:MAG: sulfatase [Proteobacteria bacterium]|nr:sulfatase [Pseudomonadota bacterium]
MAFAGAGLLWTSSGEAPRPNVYLFTVDTLRADHTTVYGYDREVTPWLEQLARRGVVFENCASTSSWTVPGVSSTLFGAYPWQLGIWEATAKNSKRQGLPSEAVSVAEVFRDAGYGTYGVAANAHISPERGYERGFEHFENVGFGPRFAVADALARIQADLAQDERPVFLWVHLFDPHEAYVYSPKHTAILDPDLKARLGEPPLDSLLMKELRKDPRTVSGQGLADLVTLYDGEIHATDAFLERVSRRFGVGDDDVVLFASDHGEEFREHGRLGHHGPLWQETVHVPLVLAVPGMPAGRRTEQVSLVDVATTLVAAAGLAPSEQWVGQDLRGDVSGARFAQLGSKHVAVLESGWKWSRVGDESRLYELPDEHTDRSAEASERAAGLKAAWESRGFPVWEPTAMESDATDEEREQLRAMGYLE